MQHNEDLNSELLAFSKKFDTRREGNAVSARGQFLRSFPLSRIKNMSLDEYVIGKGTASFCAHVEAKTKAWASIQGATSIKFGIYFGKTWSDPKKQYRFAKKFGENKAEVFHAVKNELISLITAGQSKNFREIDNNRLSQMFKAKILSLYFPDLYLNICSSGHIEQLAQELGIPENKYVSEYQHLLIVKKFENKITKDWSNPKFMSFLYSKYIRDDFSEAPINIVKKPRKIARHKVKFEDILANRDAIGKLSEDFAFEWEKNRLIGLGYPELAEKIEDRRDIPSYGYDFLSFSAPGRERYVEVKSLGKDRRGEGFRFFLSENELSVSNSDENRHEYYFYLVRYDQDGDPCDLLAMTAKDLYSSSEVSPCAYVVRFNLEHYN